MKVKGVFCIIFKNHFWDKNISKKATFYGKSVIRTTNTIKTIQIQITSKMINTLNYQTII